jgi:hypothetical protein
MTDEQIERAVERLVDLLDQRFTTTAMEEGEYNRLIGRIDDWATVQYARPNSLRQSFLVWIGSRH